MRKSTFHDLQCLETHAADISRQCARPSLALFRFLNSMLISRLTFLRVDSQDYGPIVNYSRSGSSQFQWLLPANRNINAK